MGYRAAVITQHRKYGSDTFHNWEEFTSDFVPALREMGVHITGNDNEDYFEVDKEELQIFVARRPKDDEESPHPGYTNKELAEVLQDAIDETPETFVAWEWQ